MFEELVNAHLTDLKVSGRKIEQRMAWENTSKIERLERALKSARGRMGMLPNLSARTN
jgi:hypothetical protein